MDETQMPQYQCHKKVWALRVEKVMRNADGSGILTIVDKDFAPVKVDHDYMHRHKPQADGYYVVYEDGYKSWSPADAFEQGYSRL